MFYWHHFYQIFASPAAVSAFGSTALISLVPNVILFLFPTFWASSGNHHHGAPTSTATSSSSSSRVWWQWGQSLAAGGLMGDVFLHTLPHALGPEAPPPPPPQDPYRSTDDSAHDHHRTSSSFPHASHDNDNTVMGIYILGGFLVFLTVDILLRTTQDVMMMRTTVSSSDATQQQQHGHGAGHSHGHVKLKVLNNGQEKTSTTSPNRNDPETANRPTSWSLVVLNLTADALHNFTDGLAIGASYAAAAAAAAASPPTTSSLQPPPPPSEPFTFAMMSRMMMRMVSSPGSVATLSILLHEVPHELGDYCTLVAAGYTPWQAVRTQFVTAVAAFGGTAVALVMSSSSSSSNGSDHHPPNSKDMLLLGTAGGFLYLAATTLLPHVLNEPVGRPWHRLGHLVAFVVGLAFMYAVAFLEEQEEHDHHGHDHHHHHHLHDHHHRHHHEL